MVYICNEYYKCIDREAYTISMEIMVLTVLDTEEEMSYRLNIYDFVIYSTLFMIITDFLGHHLPAAHSIYHILNHRCLIPAEQT